MIEKIFQQIIQDLPTGLGFLKDPFWFYVISVTFLTGVIVYYMVTADG